MSIRPHLVAEMAADPTDPRHGTRTGYGYGCRCFTCVEREKIRATAKRRALGVPPKRSPLHGSVSRYRYGCRCEKCRAAQTEAAAKLRRQKAYRSWAEEKRA